MKIVSIAEHARVDGISLYPLIRYVFPDDVALNLIRAVTSNGHNIEYTVSSFNAYERRYCAQENGRLAFFRHTAWGDQLMASAVVNAVQKLRPDLRLDVYCAPTVLNMWIGTAKAYPSPMHFDGVKSYNYHAFYEGMLENNGEPDQDNAIDDMLGFIGFKVEDVPDTLKIPVVQVHPDDYKELEGINRLDKYVIVQLQASNPNRTYPPMQTCQLIQAILENTVMGVILVGLDKENKLTQLFSSLSNRFPTRFLNLVNKIKNFRSHIPLVQQATAVIAPDSAFGHLAAAFPTVPTISLWGLFDPNDRVKYYKNHHPLVGFDVCPHAPCHNHQFTLPQTKCKDASNATLGVQHYCNALRSISVESIMSKLYDIT